MASVIGMTKSGVSTLCNHIFRHFKVEGVEFEVTDGYIQTTMIKQMAVIPGGVIIGYPGFTGAFDDSEILEDAYSISDLIIYVARGNFTSLDHIKPAKPKAKKPKLAIYIKDYDYPTDPNDLWREKFPSLAILNDYYELAGIFVERDNKLNESITYLIGPNIVAEYNSMANIINNRIRDLHVAYDDLVNSRLHNYGYKHFIFLVADDESITDYVYRGNSILRNEALMALRIKKITDEEQRTRDAFTIIERMQNHVAYFLLEGLRGGRALMRYWRAYIYFRTEIPKVVAERTHLRLAIMEGGEWKVINFGKSSSGIFDTKVETFVEFQKFCDFANKCITIDTNFYMIDLDNSDKSVESFIIVDDGPLKGRTAFVRPVGDVSKLQMTSEIPRKINISFNIRAHIDGIYLRGTNSEELRAIKDYSSFIDASITYSGKYPVISLSEIFNI